MTGGAAARIEPPQGRIAHPPAGTIQPVERALLHISHWSLAQMIRCGDDALDTVFQTCCSPIMFVTVHRRGKDGAIRTLVNIISSTPRVFVRGCGQARFAGNSGAIAKKCNAAAAAHEQPDVEIILTRVLSLY